MCTKIGHTAKVLVDLRRVAEPQFYYPDGTNYYTSYSQFVKHVGVSVSYSISFRQK